MQTLPNIPEIMEKYIQYAKNVTVYRPECAWKSLAPFFANKNPNEVTRELCRQYTELRQKTVGNATISRELGVLRAAINRFCPRHLAQFELPPAPPPSERYMKHEEFGQLLQAAQSPHLKIFLLLAVLTGARKMALFELTWNRVDMENRIINLVTDDMFRKKPRAVVPINPMLYEILEHAKARAKTGYVLEYRGKPIRSIKISFNNARRQAGLSDVTPHTLRHTAAVWMAQSRVPIPEIARFLGHKDSRITERVYLKYNPDMLRDASNQLAQATAAAVAPFGFRPEHIFSSDDTS